MTLPAWLLDRLIEQGHLVPKAGLGAISRAARHRHCPGCGQVVITGLDADLAARPCVVDPTPLTTKGEALAAISGRYTVTLRPGPKGWQLDPREAIAIRNTPADHIRAADVLPAHVCHQVLSGPGVRRPSQHERPRRTSKPMEAPF